MKYELIIVAILLSTLIIPITTTVYAGSWEEDSQECYNTGGYWKHNFCVYD